MEKENVGEARFDGLSVHVHGEVVEGRRHQALLHLAHHARLLRLVFHRLDALLLLVQLRPQLPHFLPGGHGRGAPGAAPCGGRCGLRQRDNSVQLH